MQRFWLSQTPDIHTNEPATAALASEPRQNQTLGGRPFIIVADITALTATGFMKVSKLAVPQELANRQARPSAKA